MQHAYEDLENQVFGVRGNHQVKHNMKVDNSEDERVCDERAEYHTRPQLKMLTDTLRKRRDQCRNKDVRDAFDEALRPLEARQARYDAIRKAQEDLIIKQQVRTIAHHTHILVLYQLVLSEHSSLYLTFLVHKIVSLLFLVLMLSSF
jgi:hypothetical protein